MPDGALALTAGTLLAILALVIVLAPLVSGTNDVAAAKPVQGTADDEGSAVAALREIEFDRATGKLSDEDYTDLKQRYTRAALAELRTAEGAPRSSVPAASAETLSIDAAVEAAIDRARQMQRECVVCGPRPEPDAIYCSSCGRYLPGNCGTCGANVELVGSRFCSQCGTHLAAA